MTRPSKLRYDDILEDIESSTANIMKLAKAASQAEQRNMHPELIETKQMLISTKHARDGSTY